MCFAVQTRAVAFGQTCTGCTLRRPWSRGRLHSWGCLLWWSPSVRTEVPGLRLTVCGLRRSCCIVSGLPGFQVTRSLTCLPAKSLSCRGHFQQLCSQNQAGSALSPSRCLFLLPLCLFQCIHSLLFDQGGTHGPVQNGNTWPLCIRMLGC